VISGGRPESGCPALTALLRLGWASRHARPLSLVAALALTTNVTIAQTTITLTPLVVHTNVQRFGIDLSGQSFYDSGQMLRNLVARNPGFEGELWQSILHCNTVTSNTCTDENAYETWPANFLAGGRYEVLSTGATGLVAATTAAHPPQGVTLTLAALSQPLKPGDFVLASTTKPGDPTAGWWPSTSGGGNFAAETQDLSPHTVGHQALRMEAAAPGQKASVASYFDTLAGHSFVHLHGLYRLSFRAKGLSPGATIAIKLARLDPTHGVTFLDRSLALKSNWNDYVIDIPTNESVSAIGSVALSFSVQSASALLDDVDLSAPRTQDNDTAFRDEVVKTLRDLRPGTLRYMDNGASFGSSLENLLAAPMARQRSGASTQETRVEDVPIGLPEFLGLCHAVGADPWITLPPGLSPAEMTRLMEYFAQWTPKFHKIHLELGNEQWNARSFAGATINDPTAYGHRAAAVFEAARRSPQYRADKFDMIIGSWLAVPWWTQQELAAVGSSADTVAVAPYLFSEFNAAPNEEQTFGPMLAQPEQMEGRATGLMAQQAKIAAAAHKGLAVYETNLGTMSGSVPQSAIDVTVPSIGAGLAVADHMLLMLRELGVTTQNLFALPEYRNDFTTPADKESVPLWGAVIDMGGATNRRRPTFLALQIINGALLSTEYAVRLQGVNPTWNQPLSVNDKIELQGAHLLQAFAFGEGKQRSLILLNLSRNQALPVSLTGAEAPVGRVTQTVLTSRRITDSNEREDLVEPRTTQHAAQQSLPPYSMTVLTWTKP
jgi:hypothetical protein